MAASVWPVCGGQPVVERFKNQTNKQKYDQHGDIAADDRQAKIEILGQVEKVCHVLRTNQSTEHDTFGMKRWCGAQPGLNDSVRFSLRVDSCLSLGFFFFFFNLLGTLSIDFFDYLQIHVGRARLQFA